MLYIYETRRPDSIWGGGNKVRLFEYIAADIVESGKKKIITFGSMHSNHVRVAAIVANYLGIKCDLILLEEDSEQIGDEIITPNLKMIKLCRGINIIKCKTSEAHSFIDEYLATQDDYYWIPGGGHLPCAVYGYADAFKEILDQLESTNIDAIFLPCGTGTTQSGLIFGAKNRIPIIGITVAREVSRCKSEIEKLLNALDYRFCDEEITVLPCDIKYGEKSDYMDNVRASIQKNDGILLDPIYNGKAFTGMAEYLIENKNLKNVLYINTGGQPNIYA